MGNSCLIQNPRTPTSDTNGHVAFFTRPKNRTLFKKRPTKKNVTVTKVISKQPTETAIIVPEKKREYNFLTSRDRELIHLCWRRNIEPGRRDLFHKAMLYCIQASPKMNEIIACGHYCYRDLTKWPKLNRICQAMYAFFDKLINQYEMDEERMYEACVQLGEMHANYAQYGLKPHFLDIFQQQLLGIIARLEMDDKVETCIAFTHLISFVVDVMIQAYSKKASDIRANTR